MVDKATLQTEFDRGFVDGQSGKEKNLPRQGSALNAFLDGLFGSRSSDEIQAAYEQGYREGLARRRSEAETATV